MRQGKGPQSMTRGAISKETRLRIQAPESFVSCVFLLWLFSGLFYDIPVPQLFHRALPPGPSTGNTIVKESLGHVTVRECTHS